MSIVLQMDLNIKGKRMLTCYILSVQQSNNQIKKQLQLMTLRDLQIKLRSKSWKINQKRIENHLTILYHNKRIQIRVNPLEYFSKLDKFILILMNKLQQWDTTFDKITSFVQQRLFYISKDIEQSKYEGKTNYLEDLTELSEHYSEDIVKDSKKLEDDNKIIEEIQKQFETLFSNLQYLQLNQTMKNAKSQINEGTQSQIVIQPIKKIIYTIFSYRKPHVQIYYVKHIKTRQLCLKQNQIKKLYKDLCVLIV
ncbi:unnamed protein product [Paramecium pentaurelia]|uniref:Uncharacterized protein n=1 Tax=Paramecium pentaurelia TaxID=43138 RepID=A0A8S1YP05_9CILI|nr:unnamed protein product [Paramecium pentaurelia]